MPIAAGCVWEVRNGGSDNNGGGFNVDRGGGGVDRSQQDAAHVFIDGSTITATVHTTTTQITIVGYTVSAADLGNHLNITGGTATAGVYEITAVDVPNNRWTLDRSAGTSTQTVVGRMGGAFASPGRAGQFKVAGNTIFVKYHATAYTLSTTTVNTSGGPYSDTTGGTDATRPGGLVGYDTNRTHFNSDANRPTISAGSQTGLTNGIVRLNIAFLPCLVSNIILDCNSGASNRGVVFEANVRARAIRVHVANSPNNAFRFGGGHNVLVACSATGCSTADAFAVTSSSALSVFWGCVAYSNTIHGFGGEGAAVLNGCLSVNNSGASTIGFNFRASGADSTVIASNCTAHNNGSHGFALPSTFARSHILINCLSTGNGGFGFAGVASTNSTALLQACATHNNTSGATNNFATDNIVGAITLTSGPYVDAAGGDFSLNNTAGGGAALRGVGFTGGYPGLSTTGYPDIGAVQHEDAGGGGGGGGPLIGGRLARA